MKIFFMPASAVMSRLRYAYKFVLIGLMFLLPLSVVMYYFQHEINNNIQFATLERQGVTYDVALTNLLHDALLHQGTVNRFHMDKGADSSGVLAAQARVVEDIKVVDAQDSLFGASLKTTDAWKKLKESWEALKGHA